MVKQSEVGVGKGGRGSDRGYFSSERGSEGVENT
jgi:hypothetical protein